jgi:ketosteroid isomerase-like protein
MGLPPTPAEILDCFYKEETKYMAAPPDQRDFAGGMGTVLSPNVKIFQSPDLPYSQSIYEGHDGFQKWGEEMAALFDSLVVSNPRVFEGAGAEASEVVVASTLKLRVRKTGEKWEAPLLQIIGVDRLEGQITSIRPFYWDVKGLNAAVGK